jgi:hypothetical protein
MVIINEMGDVPIYTMLPWKSSANASFRILKTAQSLVYPLGSLEETPMGPAYRTCLMQRFILGHVAVFCPAALIPAAVLPVRIYRATIQPTLQLLDPQLLRLDALLEVSDLIRLI